ncbi:MAG: DNA-processing protein DprA [Rhodocyclaceae bacterium]
MPASELADWLRLTLAPGIGGETQRRLLSAFGLPGHIFSASAAVLADTISHKQAGLLLQHDSAEDVAKALAWSNEAGNTILTLADTAYPQCLLDAPDPPTVLYVKGRVELLNAPALAIVGSRNATPQGESNAEAFAAALANAGLTIVSGLALGIDAAAHRGGLRGVGSTIAVIGTGIDRVYPARNQALARDIAASGAIISEFPLGTPALRENFPRRNRVISGLARGCLVVEAAERSGSLITARLAGEQGRDVFAIPGSIHSPLSKGCHKLIKQGAKLVDNAGDILEELGLSAQIETNAAAASAPNAETASLLDCIGHDPLDVDTLASRSGLTAEKLYAILLQMELDGRIASLPGGRFQRIGP